MRKYIFIDILLIKKHQCDSKHQRISTDRQIYLFFVWQNKNKIFILKIFVLYTNLLKMCGNAFSHANDDLTSRKTMPNMIKTSENNVKITQI